jgi:hypothetical protein
MANAIGCFYVIKLTDKLEFIKMRGKTSELHSGDDSAYIILPRLFVFWLRIVCFCGIINP